MREADRYRLRHGPYAPIRGRVGETLPGDPGVLAQEIADDIQAVMKQCAAIANELRE
jgi:hypothetical protein